MRQFPVPYVCERLRLKGTASMPFVDAVFLLTMFGSSRREHYFDELQRIVPLNVVHIIHNPGYKVKRGVHCCTDDLWHANKTIWSYAFRCGYKYILILEDDVIFGDVHLHNIRQILEKHEPRAVNLGCIPWVSYPTIISNVYKILRGGTTHAMIYNCVHAHRLGMQMPTVTAQIDTVVHKNLHPLGVFPPVAYQTFPLTKNMKELGPFWRIGWTYIRAWNVHVPGPNVALFFRVHGAAGGIGGVILVVVFSCVYIVLRHCRRQTHKTL